MDLYQDIQCCTNFLHISSISSSKFTLEFPHLAVFLHWLFSPCRLSHKTYLRFLIYLSLSQEDKILADGTDKCISELIFSPHT